MSFLLKVPQRNSITSLTLSPESLNLRSTALNPFSFYQEVCNSSVILLQMVLWAPNPTLFLVFQNHSLPSQLGNPKSHVIFRIPWSIRPSPLVFLVKWVLPRTGIELVLFTTRNSVIFNIPISGSRTEGNSDFSELFIKRKQWTCPSGNG